MNVKMMITIAVIVAGLLGATASATADITGLNVTQKNHDLAFGWLQAVVCAACGLLFIVGIVLLVMGRKTAAESARATQTLQEPRQSPPQGSQGTVLPPQGTVQTQPQTAQETIAYQPQTFEQPTQEIPQVQTPETVVNEEDETLSDLDGLDELDALGQDLGIDTGAKGDLECPVCGAEVSKDAKECPRCGEEFK